MKKLILLILTFACTFCNAQTSEINRTNHWYFGEGIGIDYSSGSPVLDTSSSMFQREACAVMSDTAGNLLFYTDGDTIWNKNHIVMNNGFGLGCESSTNGAVIVPNPGNDSIYYLFTVDCWENIGNHGLRYSVINVNANGGTGAILQKIIQLFSPRSEQLAVTRHCNGIDYWVVMHHYNQNKFYSYLVTPSGVNAIPTISVVGDTLPVQNFIGNMGSMCFSPNGKKLCFVNGYIGARLFNFNLLTGEIDNMIVLSTVRYEYGCAFSPDNSKLYVTFSGYPTPGRYISQYDLTSNDSLLITSSKNIVFLVSYVHAPLEGLQLTEQGYIKVAFYYRDSIGVILNPNAYGAACNYQTFPLTFNGRLCKEQFPNFNTNYYNSNPYSCGIGIAETENTSIKFFPNPVSDRLTVTNLNRNYDSMLIYSIDGRYVLFKPIDNKEIAEIDTRQLSSGIYFIQLSSKSSTMKPIKFVKLNF